MSARLVLILFDGSDDERESFYEAVHDIVQDGRRAAIWDASLPDGWRVDTLQKITNKGLTDLLSAYQRSGIQYIERGE